MAAFLSHRDGSNLDWTGCFLSAAAALVAFNCHHTAAAALVALHWDFFKILQGWSFLDSLEEGIIEGGPEKVRIFPLKVWEEGQAHIPIRRVHPGYFRVLIRACPAAVVRVTVQSHSKTLLGEQSDSEQSLLHYQVQNIIIRISPKRNQLYLKIHNRKATRFSLAN